jgi:hypothetical protein
MGTDFSLLGHLCCLKFYFCKLCEFHFQGERLLGEFVIRQAGERSDIKQGMSEVVKEKAMNNIVCISEISPVCCMVKAE